MHPKCALRSKSRWERTSPCGLLIDTNKHVGTILTVSSSLGVEIATRSSSMGSKSCSMSQCYFAPKVNTSLKATVTFAATVLLSPAAFQCGTWPAIHKQEYRKLQCPIVSVLRRKHPINFAPVSIIRYQRLLLFPELKEAKSPRVLNMVARARFYDRSWIRTVGQDLVWIASECHKSESINTASTAEWAEYIHSNRMHFMGMVGIAIHDSENSTRSEWCTSHKSVAACAPVQCQTCGKVFPDRQALSVHMFRAHKCSRSIRSKIDNNLCVACVQLFSSKECLVCHLAEKSRRCRIYHSLHLNDIDNSIIDELEAQSKLDRKSLSKAG